MSKKKAGFPPQLKLTGVLADYTTALRSGKIVTNEALFALHDQARVGHLKTVALRSGLVQPTVHRLRERLKPFGVNVATVKGEGYKIDTDDRRALGALIDKLWAEAPEPAEPVAKKSAAVKPKAKTKAAKETVAA